MAASGSEDEDGHGAVGEGGLVPDALRPGGGGGEGKRSERGFEVDAHVRIFASGRCSGGLSPAVLRASARRARGFVGGCATLRTGMVLVSMKLAQQKQQPFSAVFARANNRKR